LRDALLRVAADDVNEGMMSRWPATKKLIALGDTRVLDVLTAFSLQNDSIEVEIAGALGQFGDRRALGRLAWNLRSEDDDLRRVSVEALGALAQRAILPFVLQALGDENLAVQAAAARVAATVPGIYGPLSYALWDQEPRVRAGVCQALRLLGDPRAAQALCHHMRLGNQPHFVLREAAAALAVLPEEPCLAEIVMCLARELDIADDEETRIRAAELLGLLAANGGIGELIRGLADRLPRVRLAVVEALAGLDNAEVGPALVSALSDESASVRARAARMLGERPGSNIIAGLIRALEDSSTDVAVRAAESLGRLRAPAAEPALWEAYTLGGKVLRRAAAGALVRVLAEESPDRVCPLLDDEDGEIRFLVASALGERAIACVSQLIEISSGPEQPAATAAIRALGRIGTESAVTALNNILLSCNLDDQLIAVIESLRTIGTQEAIGALGIAFEQNTVPESWSAHQAAREALIAHGT
jgi:HEAT repeat protein